MLFWVICALLTFLAILSVVLPLRIARKATDTQISYDKEIYKSRILEIDNDLELERISAAEAEAAKAEEGRRLLALSKKSDLSYTGPKDSSKTNVLLLAASILFVPFFSLFAYFSYGSPQYQDMPLSERQAAATTAGQSIDQLVMRVEAELTKNPDDLRGWQVIAPVYLRAARFEDAAIALRNVLRLGGPDPEVQATLGEVITNLKGGVVTQEALKLFQDANKLAPNQIQPRFYLAMAMGQEGEYEKAVAAWKELLVDAPQDAQWPAVARSQLAEMEAKLAQKDNQSKPEAEEQVAERGPSQDDIAAARRMSGEDRMAMIQGMVESLSERLQDDPENPKGWRQLIRSYIVLGQEEKAMAAMAQAKLALPEDEKFIAEIDALAEQVKATMEN